MAVVDVTNNIGYSLSVQPTPANQFVKTTSSSKKTEQLEMTRINDYLRQLEATRPYLPTSRRYVVTDGFYSKIKWVDGVRNVYLLKNSGSHASTYAVLFSTDLELDAYSIYLYYKARFQIEFLFRDGKQFTGLADCQARDLTKLDFHFILIVL
ncbi:transposase [Pleurocapsa sp. PCC 7327]|uniref:transposase n=1 Tax=Pleurocapsa sp. PCC 7327 TaxID=118163 RepID=UPI000687D1F2|nr:transposase [Pleurocapsa sp. PCC 7327]